MIAGAGTAWGANVNDVLNQTFTGVTGTSYTAFSGKTSTSGAVYAGQCAGGNNSIQLRSNNNNSGVVTTTSGGKAKKVVVTWDINTSNGRTLNVYGKNTAFSAATDLYNTSNQGTLLGTIVYGTSTELTITDDYEFIGFRSASGAMYLTSVTITWEQGAATKVLTPSITGTEKFLESTEVTITCGTEEAAIQYSTDGGTNWFDYTSPFTLNVTTTVTAKATKSGLTDSDEASKTFTKITPMTVAEAIDYIDNNSGDVLKYQYVTGTISQIDSYASKQITYWISDDGTTTTQMEVYKGKGLNGADFSAVTDLNVGDVVTVYGNLTLYNSTTYEFSAGSQIMSLVSKPTPELAWSAASYTATYGGSITYPTLSNPNSVTVTYSSSDSNIATIDPSTGEITLKANGETDITASFAGDVTYRAQEVSYTLTVAGMKSAPGFSFAEEEINMAYNEDYTGQTLTNPNSLSVTYESSNTDVAEVDENTGELALYKAGTVTITANFAGDATYAEGSVSYTINITKAAAGLAFADAGPFYVAPNADFDVPALTNPHSLNVAWSSTDEDIAVADADAAVIGSKLGTAVITASFDGDDRYNAGEASYTIIVTNDIVVTWDLSTDQTTTATTDEMTWTNANVTMAAAKGSASTNTNNYYPGTSGQSYTSTRFYKNSTLTITPLNGYAIKSVVFTATTPSYASTLANSTWTNATVAASGTIVTVTPTSGTSAIFATIGGTTGHSAVTVTLTKSISANLNASGYATFAANAPLDFTNDSEFSAWQITDVTTSAITFSQITGTVAAGTGVLLKGAASETINIPVAASGSDISDTNKLVGITSTTTIDANTYYGLSGNKFVKVGEGTVKAGKALLPASEILTLARELTFVFENGETTGINAVNNEQTVNGAVYNLNGQRVETMKKGGLYIQNGKKFINK